MFLIGTKVFHLKIFRSLPVLCFLCLSLEVFALDRKLTPDEITKLEQNVAADPTNVMSRRFLVDHFFKDQNWARVMGLAAQYHKDLPASTLIQVARAHIEAGDAAGAEAVAGHYHSRFPPSAAMKILEARALLMPLKREKDEVRRRAKIVTAVEIYRSAILINPKDPGPYLAWISTLKEYFPANADEAIQVYKMLESATGDFESYIPEKCSLYVRAALWDQGITACQRAAHLRPGQIANFIFLARAQRVKLDLETAKTTLLKAAVDNPESPDLHLELADLYFDEKNFVSASEHYRNVINLDPQDADAFLGLAESEYEQKKYDEALAAYGQNCKLSRTVASEFKSAAGHLRTNNDLHNKYKKVISTCR